MHRLIIGLILVCIFTFVGDGSAREITISTFERPSRLTAAVEPLVTEAYRRLGHHLRLVKMPGERSLITADEGGVDGELFRVGDVGRNYGNLVRVPVNLRTLDVVVFTRNVFFPVKGWDSLIPYKVGYRRGIKAVEYRLKEDIETISAATYVPVFKMLEAGRCDVVVASRTSGMEAIDVLQLKGLSILEPPLAREPLYHYLHVRHEDLVVPLTRVLQQMQSEGLLKK